MKKIIITLLCITGILLVLAYSRTEQKSMLQKISKLDADKKVYNLSEKTNGTYYVSNSKVYYETDHPITSPYNSSPSDDSVSTDITNFRGFICALGSSYRCEYGIDSSSIYYKGKKIKNIDEITFELVFDKKEEFIKDKNHVYSPNGKHIIKDADPNSFELIENGGTSNTDLAMDNNFVFQRGIFFVKNEEIDRESLDIIYRDHVVTYLKDKNSVFYKNRDDNDIKKITEADRNSFISIDQQFSKDHNSVFFWKNHSIEKIKDIDPKSFQHISGYWYKDYKNIYYVKYNKIEILKNVDPNDFKVIEYDIGASLNAIYYRNKIVEDIDRKTFKKIGESHLFIDKNSLYKGVKKIDINNVDTSSFQQIGTKYFKDDNNIYFYNYHEVTIVQDADLETFTPICYECEYAEDKNNKFHGANID